MAPASFDSNISPEMNNIIQARNAPYKNITAFNTLGQKFDVAYLMLLSMSAGMFLSCGTHGKLAIRGIFSMLVITVAL
jgi:hypothetical protein